MGHATVLVGLGVLQGGWATRHFGRWWIPPIRDEAAYGWGTHCVGGSRVSGLGWATRPTRPPVFAICGVRP